MAGEGRSAPECPESGGLGVRSQELVSRETDLNLSHILGSGETPPLSWPLPGEGEIGSSRREMGSPGPKARAQATPGPSLALLPLEGHSSRVQSPEVMA